MAVVTKKSKIGCLIDKDDPHWHQVEIALAELNAEVTPLALSRFPQISSVSFHPTNQSIIVGQSDRPECNLLAMDVIWYRNREHLFDFSSNRDPVLDYIVNESRDFLAGCAASLPLGKWVNNLENEIKAKRKPYQLIIAQQSGFKIPPTLISNDEVQIQQFISLNPDFAIKPVALGGVWFQTQEQQHSETNEGTMMGFYTQRWNAKDFEPHLANVQHCPTIFQAYIPKAYELRITMVGDTAYACAIHSQQSEKSATDWRNYDLDNTPYEVVELPKEVEAKCQALMHRLGLEFGAIDMIVTPDGEYVFLEINPRFAWLWIEERTRLPISRAIAEHLVALAERNAKAKDVALSV